MFGYLCSFQYFIVINILLQIGNLEGDQIINFKSIENMNVKEITLELVRIDFLL